MFEVKLNQAHLLQTYFAFYCGSPRAFHQAELSHGALVVACKRMHLLRPGISAVDDYRASNVVIDPHELYRRHKEDVTRAMLGWGIYVGRIHSIANALLLDTQLAALLNIPAHLSIAELDAPFPTTDWIAQAWTEQPLPTFADVIDAFLTHGSATCSLDDFGYSLIAYTMYR